MAVPSIGAFGGATTISPGANPRSVSFDIGTPSNSKLFVGFNTQDVDDEISSVTWNGVSMTRVGRSGASTVNDCDMWVLDAPDGGTQTLEFSYTGDGTYGGVVWWVRVDDAGAVGTLFTASGTGTSVSSGSQTCPTNGMLLAFAVHQFSTTAPTISAGTNIALTQPTNRRPVAGYRTSTGTISWTFASSQGWNLVGVPISEISSGSLEYTATLDAGYAVQAQHIAALAAGYAVQASHTASFNAGYNVQASHAATLDAGYAVQAQHTATLAAAYGIEAQHTATLAAGYAVQAQHAASLDVGYAIQSAHLAQLAAGYAVQAQHTATLDAGYAVAYSAGSGDPEAIWEGFALEAGLTPGAMLRIVMAAVAGRTDGIGTNTERYFSVDGSKPRITATFDSAGNRTTIVLDGSP